MRLFIAVPAPAEAAAAVAGLIAELKGGGADVKWVDATNVHLTLSFQGETPAERVPLLKAAAAAAAGRAQAFDAELQGLGAFPSLKDPAILWIGVGKGGAELAALAAALKAELKERGLLPEAERARPFTAHVTIGRRRGLKDRHALRRRLAAASFTQALRVDRLALFESRLGPRGPVYVEIFSAPLCPKSKASG